MKDPPILDWHHIATRLQHAKLSAGGLADDTSVRAGAKDFLVAQVERFHWRIWNGKARNARVTIERTQSWDIALTADGPVFLELNYGGDLNLHQPARGAGALDETYREYLQRCGYHGKL